MVAGVVVVAVAASVGRLGVDEAVDVAGVQGSIHPLFQSALAVAWLIPSLLLVRRRAGLPFGWLGLAAATAHALAAIAVAAAPTNEWAEWAALWLIVIEVPLLGAIVQLFPTGRPLDGWHRYLALSMAAGGLGVAAAAVEAVPGDAPGSLQSLAGGVLVPLLAFSNLGAVVPLFVRSRRSAGAEQRAARLLLVVVGAGVMVPGLVAVGGRSAEVAAQVFTVGELVFITVAVLRHRVWGLAPMVRGTLQRVVVATDAERRRIRAELHDGVGAGLTAVRLKVDAAHGIIEDRPTRAMEMLESASGDLGLLVDDVRRLVDGLRPAVLDRVGLASALELRASALSASSPELSITICDDGVADRLGHGADAAVYLLVTEALNNVVRHAGATRRVVTFSAADSDVVVEVVDDGAGPTDLPTPAGGLGLSSMSARAAEVGGYVVVRREPSGGFRVRATIPLGSP